MRDRFKVRGSRFKEGPTPPAGEQGYMLLGLMVAIAIILLMLGVAASKAAFSIRRDREVETVRRGNQYVRAIREFYLKNGSHYPGSIEQLEKTNNVRFLRQRYIDPITGKDDWRLIVVGQNQTTVKGFFGEDLQGLPNAGLGSAAGLASGFGGTPAPTAVSGTGATSGGAGAPGTPGAGGTGQGTGGGLGSAGSAGGLGGFGFGSGTGTSMGPIMGVGLNATGNSLLEPNAQTTYQTWEFLYDPRIELLKVKQGMNQGLGSAGAGALGQTPGGLGQSNGFGQSGGFGQSNGPSPNGTSSPTGAGQQAPGGFSTQP
jgi:type II secretory pathway pseudopilin PulG